jgi:hypothetical protein
VSNTAAGTNALLANTSGYGNTAIGTNALSFNTVAVENTALGDSALATNSTGQRNTAVGRMALLTQTGGSDNTAVGQLALITNDTGNGNTAVGAGADVLAGNLTNATAIGFNAFVDASNKIRLGNSSVTVIEGQVALTFPSDRNKKENFRPVDGEAVLGKLRGLKLTSWNYIGHDPAAFRHYGPIAQEFFAAFGHDGVGTIGTPTTMNSGDEAGILMIAAQALEKRTAELKQLEARVAELEALVRSLLTAGQRPAGARAPQ